MGFPTAQKYVYYYTPIDQALKDDSIISWDIDIGCCAHVILSGNRTLSILNAWPCQFYTIKVMQDSVGNRTLTLPSGSKVVGGGGGIITLSTNANAMDILTFYYDGTTYWWTYGVNFT